MLDRENHERIVAPTATHSDYPFDSLGESK
jgi:hypothetical protein